MGLEQRDVSVSPMTRSPQAASPANDKAGAPFTPPKRSDSLHTQTTLKQAHSANLAEKKLNGSHERANESQPSLAMGSVSPSPAAESPTALPHSKPAAEDRLDDSPQGSGDLNASADSPTAAGRRSVQFARFDPPEIQGSHSRHGSWDGPDSPGKPRAASIMSKLKNFTTGAGLQSPKSPNGTSEQPGSNSPTTGHFVTRLPETLQEEQSDVDADADADADVETADEANIPDNGMPKKKRRRMRRFVKGDLSNPTSPFRFPNEGDPFGYNRLLRRRASMPDTSGGASHQVLSEGEGREQARRRPFAKRGHSWMHPGGAAMADEGDDAEHSAAVGRRHGHARRTTVFGGGGVSDGDAILSRRPFFKSERASNFGAQKWKQVKSTLKLLRQKKEDRFDYFKSAELMAELRAGAPAVLMFASMIQRDEHGNKRIPVLLEQLKLTIKDSAPMPDDESERHWIFTMELEYGSGPSRMVWTITRTIRDIYNLHFRYRFALNNDKYMPGRLDLGTRPKQPKFPYSAFPYLRGARNKEESSDEEEEASGRGEQTADEYHDGVDDGAGGIASDGGAAPRHPRRKKSRVNMLGIRRRSTGFAENSDLTNTDDQQLSAEAMRQRYVEKQRRILEKYLSEMIRWLMFRADSNRLCRFLELSALGVRLAAEGSYHGKEGYLHIQSSKGLDFRRVLTPAKVIARHSRKWFLVRQSYIVCVESPENMNIYDVYLVDNKFSIVSKRNPLKQIASKNKQAEIDLTVEAPAEKHHTLTLHTSERKVRLFSRNHAVMKQFEESITEMLRQTVWYDKKRFESFAPVRTGVFAQWLVDGRDYMWNVSRAINMAKDVIYIHDWWLSPELYMRRPACISQKWRLDRLLQRKAQEGVKVFVIIYRNVEAAIPIDSEYTKFSLLNLHPNIFVQRSPNQFKKNQFFFAHHEKICIVDHDVAFLGGVDLCFGRWDCPQHPIVDDKPTGFEMTDAPKDAEHCQLFAGKDYSNPRVQDFFRLSEPYEEMYDRTKVPRMPWHDIGMQVVGQPARDLTRHFVQRWNYLRRGRKSTRPLPFLLPPPDAKFEELEAMGLTGTCEVQMLRSASTWSLGLEETEHSIQNAYVKMIEDSEHFVYMENQFFITSTEAYNTKIVNRIGDALVNRIIRAHENGENWRCVIVIPLMPGFQNTVDEQEGTSVRLIVMCQYRSICRGEQSIFGRLRAEGIEPEDYINFFSLRQWGIMSNDALVTEQLYIHAKAIIVDDRVALIGSANINERSMLGNRDSECAAIVRDTDMIWSTMDGKPYQVGRFAHTLRLRLMREHLGLDVDEILEEERQQEMEREAFEERLDEIYNKDPLDGEPGPSIDNRRGAMHHLPSFNNALDMDMAKASYPDTPSRSSSPSSDDEDKGKEPVQPRAFEAERHYLDVSGHGPDQWKSAEQSGLDGGRDSVVINGREVLIHNIDTEGKGTLDAPQRQHRSEPTSDNPYLVSSDNSRILPPVPPFDRRSTDQLGLPRTAQLPNLPVTDDTDIGGPAMHVDPVTGKPTPGAFHPLAADIKLSHINKDCMRDPISADFIDEIWNRVARNNTKLYRRVFRCMPDSAVNTWAEYRDFVEYGKKFRESMDGKPATDEQDLTHQTSQGQAAGGSVGVAVPDLEALARASGEDPEKVAANLTETHADVNNEKEASPETEGEKNNTGAGDRYADGAELSEKKSETANLTPVESNAQKAESKAADRKTTFSALEKPATKDTAAGVGSVKRRRRATTKGSRRWSSADEMPSRADAEELLKMIQGNIVEFPYDWLVTEEINGNWGYQVDGVAPITI
ncbi:Phospholipase D1 [Lecanicillium sp. MT-2017a]|nr:Phospholipase D1 [Lecanicillium sp. MT-2017a]